MASATIHGKFDLDLRGKKVEGLAEATVNGDAVRLEQLGGSNTWQESAQLSYNSGQRVSDFVIKFQGRVTTGVVESIGGANIYDFNFDVFEKPTDENDSTYFQRFSINPVSGVEIIQVIDVQRNTPNTGQTRITLQPPINANFTLTYPPTNFGVSVGAAVREYTRRPLGLNPAPTNPTPAQKLELRPSTAVFAFDDTLEAYVSDYWILELITGDMWRPFQDYVVGDEVQYRDSQGIPRHVFCNFEHTSSESTNPILPSSVSHIANGNGASIPWEPVGAAIDLSTGTFEAPVQILVSDGGAAAVALNGGNQANEDRWFINVGQGTSAIQLPASQIPSVGDLISFGIGANGTTEEYRISEVVAVGATSLTSLRFDGSYPAEVQALVDDNTANPVNLFNAGLRTDFGQVDRFVFDPSDFAINTEAQDIGHAHVSLTANHPSLPPLHYGGVWTNGGTATNPVYASEVIDIIGIIGDQHVDHTFANIGAWQADTTTNFEVGQYVSLTSSNTARFKITTASVGYDANGFTEFAVGDEDVENLILATASDISRAGGRFPTTEAWQNNRFALKGEAGGVDVETTFPDPPTLGEQIFLNVAVSHTDGTNQRPRGFYSYIQPSSDPASRFWEQVTLSEVGQLFNNARVGDIIYLENAETNFNTVGNDFEPGFYRASATATATPNHTTWTAIGSGDIPEIQGEIDAIQAHEGVIDDRLTELESQVTHLEQTYGGAYIWAGNATINSLLSENRVDSQGNNPSASNILSSEYNEDTNILRWWIASTSSDTEISQLIASGDAIGFSNGILDPIPFVPFESGANATNTAKYIDFKLQQPDTYEATLISYADENEVIFSTTLYFYNTANVNFNQADHDAGDHHIVDVLTAAERALVDGLVAGTADLTVNDLDVNGGLIVDGGNDADIRFNHSIEVRETNNNASANPSISINRRSNSPLAGDDIGLVEFKGTTTDGTDETDDTNYAVLGGDIVSESTALPVGQLYIKVADGTAATTNQAKHITINGKAAGGAIVNLASDTDLVAGGTVNGADSNAVAYVAIQLSAGIPTEINPTGAVAGHVYLQYTARYNGTSVTLVDDINTTADPVTATTYINFVSVANPGTEIPQQ